MPNKETGSPIKEEPFLRTARGRLAVASLSVSMLLTASIISEATKPKPQEEYYDPNQTPIIIRMSDEEMKRFFVTPKPIEEIPNLRDIEHVLPEEIEKMLEEENLTEK